MVHEALAAADNLEANGVKCGVFAVSSIGGATNESVAAVVSRFPTVVTVEAHYATGGLGSLVSEVVAEKNIHCRVVRCGVRRLPDGHSGSKTFLQNEHGISKEALVRVVTETLKPK